MDFMNKLIIALILLFFSLSQSIRGQEDNICLLYTSCYFNYFEMEFIENDLFMYFGETLVLVQDESTDSLVIIIFR